MTEQEKKTARNTAIRKMNYFHEDKNMYIFWRNVYRYYQNKITEAQRAAFRTRKKKGAEIS